MVLIGKWETGEVLMRILEILYGNEKIFKNFFRNRAEIFIITQGNPLAWYFFSTQSPQLSATGFEWAWKYLKDIIEIESGFNDNLKEHWFNHSNCILSHYVEITEVSKTINMLRIAKTRW